MSMREDLELFVTVAHKNLGFFSVVAVIDGTLVEHRVF